MLVKNLYTKFGNVASNEVVLEENGDLTFYSYTKKIATYTPKTKKLTLTKLWTFSKTTNFYLLQFLKRYCGIKTNKNELAAGTVKNIDVIMEEV